MKTDDTRLKLGSGFSGHLSYTNPKSIILLTVGFVVGISVSQLNFTRSTGEKWPYSDIKQSYITEFGPVLDYEKHNHSNENTAIAKKLYNEVKVLCWVMTNPENHQKKARHVQKTWGKRCNKFLFMSSEYDKELEVIALPVEEGTHNLWGKAKEAFKYIYKHHLNEYDWFLKADDDTYVIVENLRQMLYPYDPKTPLYFGCRFKKYVQLGYMSGGAGYVLSREALRRFIEIALKVPKNCRKDAGGSEDLDLGICLENVGVIEGDSRASSKFGRFFPLHSEFHVKPKRGDPKFWYWYYLYYKSDEGLDSCSDYAISFHASTKQMYVLDYLVYHLRPYGKEIKVEPLPAKSYYSTNKYPIDATIINHHNKA